MASLIPAAVYGLEVPAGETVPAIYNDFPGSIRITMAAIDPTAEAVHPAELPYDAPPRATLKLIRVPIDDDDEDDEDDEDGIEDLLNGDFSDESSEDDEANGGPSDPSKSKKAKREAGIKALKAALEKGDDDEEMDDAVAAKLNKGKGVASEDDDDEGSELGSEEPLDAYVVCTLDPAKNYQQPLDITIGERESVYFEVVGTHSIYLTGNHVVPVDGEESDSDSDSDEEGYDLSPDEDEIYPDDEDDMLDDLEDPRITEVDDEEEEVPKLIMANGTGKKRGAEAVGLDDLIKADKKTGAKQKKQKNNAGEAVTAPKPEPKKSDKKVQFAKNLEQGPTPSGDKKQQKKNEKSDKPEQQKKEDKKPPKTRTVQGVFVDDRVEGSGAGVRKGQKVGMRYIGKFADGKVFDSNKKGKPFSFTLGAGEVIKGWDIGVEGMKVGGERRIKVPANLAYGSRPPPGMPKNAELTFDMKLVEIR